MPHNWVAFPLFKNNILQDLSYDYDGFCNLEARTDNKRNLEEQFTYDHLGSWTTITDSQGNVEQELSFDAWGTLRNAETWTGAATETPMFDRGFTGHEHLYAFGIINMNGRMYDPLMSSFLSVDAYVQSPDNAQNFNRYAYCLNNPLKYVDPSGWLMQGAMMGTPGQGVHDWGNSLHFKLEPRDLDDGFLSEDFILVMWRHGDKLDGGDGSVGGGATLFDGGMASGGVLPVGNKALETICNTLPFEARSFVRLDANGMIDKDLLNSYSGESLNVAILKILANSDKTIELLFNDNFTYLGQDGELGYMEMSYFPYDPMYSSEDDIDLYGETINGLSTGESGFMGITLFPDLGGVCNSPNDNIIVVINKNLSSEGAAEVYSHEMNGHAFLYVLNGGDHNGASHQPVGDSWVEGNNLLKFFIISSKKETIYNRQRP